MIKIESLKDIEQLIKDGVEEGLTLEYKKDINNDKIAKEVCAFANVRGGVLVLGVIEEARKPIELIGIDPTGAEERILNIVRDSIQPDIADIIKVKQPFPIELSDKFIMVVEVPESLDAPHMWNYRYYKRQGSESVPMEDHEVKTVRFEKGIRTALVEEIKANFELAKKTSKFIDSLTPLMPEKRNPVIFIPLLDDAWKAVISSGYLIYLPGDLTNQLRNAYAIIHEINALSDNSRAFPGGTDEIQSNYVNVMHTPAEESFTGGTYIMWIIQSKLSKLMTALTAIQERI